MQSNVNHICSALLKAVSCVFVASCSVSYRTVDNTPANFLPKPILERRVKRHLGDIGNPPWPRVHPQSSTWGQTSSTVAAERRVINLPDGFLNDTNEAFHLH